MKNLYRLDGQPISQRHVNAMIVDEEAEWVGTDYDEEKDAYVHYAERIKHG